MLLRYSSVSEHAPVCQKETVMEISQADPGSSFNNILLATDFCSASQAAFQTALGVCNMLRAKLTILHVFEYVDVVLPETGGQLLELENVYGAAQTSLAALVRLAQKAGVSCEPIPS